MTSVPELESIERGQFHMPQLQKVSASRFQAQNMAQLLAQNQRMSLDLKTTQQRLQSLMAEHAAALTSLQAECVWLRGQVIRAKTERDLAQTPLIAKKAPAPDVRPFARLAEEYADLLAHNQRLRMRSLRMAVADEEVAVVRLRIGRQVGQLVKLKNVKSL
jgi:hypothetical protein